MIFDLLQLEAIKNQLENKLNNNLKKKEERLKRELEDITVEDHSHHLHTMSSDLTSIEARTEENKDRVKGYSCILVIFVVVVLLLNFYLLNADFMCCSNCSCVSLCWAFTSDYV